MLFRGATQGLQNFAILTPSDKCIALPWPGKCRGIRKHVNRKGVFKKSEQATRDVRKREVVSGARVDEQVFLFKKN